MTYDLLTALALFAFVSSITPGPNNLMLLSSGANFGFRRSIPHMLGIGAGMCTLILCAGAGLMQIFEAVPLTYTLLKLACGTYLLWLAWRIGTAPPPGDQRAGSRPFRFWQAALFQWVNPKAWAMALTAVTAYAPDRSLWAVALVALVFLVVNVPSVGTWTLLGQHIARVLRQERHRLVFNWTMAVLLVLSVAPMLGL